MDHRKKFPQLSLRIVNPFSDHKLLEQETMASRGLLSLDRHKCFNTRKEV